MKNGCDINYKEMNTLIKTQDKMHDNNDYFKNNHKKVPTKFRTKQAKKEHIKPISMRGLVCDISVSESLNFIPNERTRSIAIRGEDGKLYNFITSYQKRIDEFQESLDSKKDIIINAYINNKQSNKTVNRLCSAGHSSNVTIDILYSEESLIDKL